MLYATFDGPGVGAVGVTVVFCIRVTVLIFLAIQ